MTSNLANFFCFEGAPTVKGVYADLSSGRPEYYAKCPECGNVHGMFSSAQDAGNNLVCGACRFNEIAKRKEELEKITHRVPDKKRKLPWPLAVESLLEDGGDDEDMAFRSELDDVADLINSDWVEVARRELSEETGLEIEVDDGYYDPDDPNSIDTVEMRGSNALKFTVYKSESQVRELAVTRVNENLRDDPSTYSRNFLWSYVNKDRLQRILDTDLRGDGDDPPQDAVTWLEDVYGREEAVYRAIEIAGMNYDRAAEDAVRYDGWQNFLDPDNRSHILSSGAVALEK